MVDVSVHDVVQLENIGNLLRISKRGTTLDKESDSLVGTPDRSGDLVDILRLDNCLEVIFEKLGEVVLKLGTTKVLDNVLPIRRVVVSAQVGLELSAENLQGGTLSNTVCSDQTENLAGSGHGQTVQLETVGSISVGDLAFEIGGQVDDGDGIERALLGADTATDAEGLGYERELRVGLDLNTEFSAANDGARLFALLTTFSRATLVAIDDGDTGELVRHCCGDVADVASKVILVG